MVKNRVRSAVNGAPQDLRAVNPEWGSAQQNSSGRWERSNLM